MTSDLFDPRFFLYFEEVDHCYRARQAGWPVVYYPHTQVLHIGGESAELVAKLTVGRQISESQIESELLYFRKHRGLAGVLNAVLLGTLGDAASADECFGSFAATGSELLPRHATCGCNLNC